MTRHSPALRRITAGYRATLDWSATVVKPQNNTDITMRVTITQTANSPPTRIMSMIPLTLPTPHLTYANLYANENPRFTHRHRLFDDDLKRPRTGVGQCSTNR